MRFKGWKAVAKLPVKVIFYLPWALGSLLVFAVLACLFDNPPEVEEMLDVLVEW